MPGRPRRVVLYGGTKLERPVASFVERLAEALLHNESIRLAVGGFKGESDDRTQLVSTDICVRDGALKFVKGDRDLLKECLETWLPEGAKDRKDVDPHRFREGEIHELDGYSAQARRVKLVQIADALVTVSGHVQSMLLLEIALATGRPAVPLVFTGGDSKDHWSANRGYYYARLALGAEQAKRWEEFKLDEATPDSAIRNMVAEVVPVVNRVIGRKCLILMQFKKSDKDLRKVIEGEGFQPIRLDQDLFTGDVRNTVQQLIEECDAVIADITELSANVMYEVGLAHSFKKNPAPLLIWSGAPEGIGELPFYLKPHRVATAKDAGGTMGAVREYLRSVKSGAPPARPT